MKTNQIIYGKSNLIIMATIALAMIAVMAMAPNAALAQDYSVSWYSIDGGGNVSGCGPVLLQGTIGQFDAGNELVGATYTLRGGFQSIGSAFVLGDLNDDGIVNLLDVAPFVDAITNGIFIPAADINGDGSVDLLDVNPFVELLTN